MTDWRELAKHWLMVMWHNPLLILTVLLLGSSFTFVFSYIPLYGGKNWEIDYLQSRVEAQNQELRALQIDLSTTRSDAANRPEAGAIDGIQKELRQAEGQLAKLESKAKSDQATIKSLRKTRDQWKNKYQDAAKEREALAASAQAPPMSSPASPASGTPEAPESRPAPMVEPLVKPVAKPAPPTDGPPTAEWDAPPEAR